MKLKKLYFKIGGVLIIILLIEYLLEQIYHSKNNDKEYMDNIQLDELMAMDDYVPINDILDPIILWWSPLMPEEGSVTTCETVSCYFTHDRRFKGHPLQRAVIFYGSAMNVMDLPLPRKSEDLWVLFHEDSPRSFPPLTSEYALSLFNLTGTFSRHSHFPLTLQNLKNLNAITSKKYVKTVEEKNKLIKKKNFAPVLYIQSNCNTPSNRDSYVYEMMKYIKIDSYGLCLNNKEFPDKFKDKKAYDNLLNEEFLNFVSQYKFTIAYENTVCNDYISDKLWRSLTVASIPIYYGSNTVSDWLPNKRSIIYINDFTTPESLAEYLHYLNSNDTEYNSLLKHKGNDDDAIKNELLLKELNKRKWSSDDATYIDHFECFVCKAVHKMLGGIYDYKPVTGEHYRCERPISPIIRRPNSSNWWVDAWRIAGCEALVMNNFVNTKFHNYSQQEFYGVLEKYYINNIC